jgi:hypothetical protein
MGEEEMMGRLKQMGFDVDGSGSPTAGIPSLERYIPRIAEAFTNYLYGALPELGTHMNPERVQGIVDLVDEYMFDDEGPNMLAILDLARNMELTEEQAEEMMTQIKNYMNGLVFEILGEMDLSPEERDAASQSLGYAFESMSNEEYMMTMSQAFSGKGDLGAVEDFINTSFELPDLRGISENIFDKVTDYLYENLANL